MKRYEGLFILNGGAREEGIKETIDKISELISKAGGKVETVQKMDKRHFARVSDKKATSGFYVNVIFEAPPSALGTLREELSADAEVFRTLFTVAPPKKPEAVAA